MFSFKKNKLPTLKNGETDSGTIRKNKRKNSDKGAKSSDRKRLDAIQDRDDHVIANGASADDDVTTTTSSIEPNINLSRDELLKLLSVFEGELQARDEVISILKSECGQGADGRYGTTGQPYSALQRDAATLDINHSDEAVNSQTKEHLKKIIQHQKDSHKKLKQMLMTSEEKFQRLTADAEDEKRKHQEYMIKSDDFVTLLENDRERLKQIFEQEKAVHNRKEKDLVRKCKENKEELTRLKTLSLELVEERQRQLQTLTDSKQMTSSLQNQVDLLTTQIKEAESTIKRDKLQATDLENELEEQNQKFFKENEDLTSQLKEQLRQNTLQQDKIDNQSKQLKKLKSVQKELRKTDDQLWRIQEKLEKEEEHESLLEEVEVLRSTVRSMQEAEKIYTQGQEECKDLEEALVAELAQTKILRVEVESLRKSAKNEVEMKRCVEETNFRFDEIKNLFENEEKKVVKMNKQIEELQTKVGKMDESENLLKTTEQKLKQIHEVTKEIREERDAFETKYKLEKEKSQQYKDLVEDERTKVTEITQKIIEESKKVLKLKEELAALETRRVNESETLRQKISNLDQEKENLVEKSKVEQNEKLVNNLRRQIVMLKTRLDKLENDEENKEQKLKLAQQESEQARLNLQISTEKLRKLVAMGFNEQAALSKCDEIKSKYLDLETANESLITELKILEKKIQENPINSNNNNINIKTEVTNISTQTNNNSNGDHNKTTTRNVTVKRTPSRGSEQGLRTNFKRLSSSGVSTSTKATPRISLNEAGKPPKQGSFVVRLKASGEDPAPAAAQGKPQGPVSMTISHDPETGATPNFRIVRDAKTGSSRIETTLSENSRLAAQVRNPTHPKNSAELKPPPSSPSANKKAAKITSRASVNPATRARTESRKKSIQLTRKPSISPTRIPKLRSSTPTNPSPKLPRNTRGKIADNPHFLRDKQL